MKFWISVTFIVGYFLMCGSASGAAYCGVPVVTEAVDRAEAVFSGRIVGIVKVGKNDASSQSVSSESIVTFEIEEWWKGVEHRELRVLWRPEILGCSYFPVGEIGERYLVYADSHKSDVVGEDRLLEITILNRTSKIPRTEEVLSPFRSGKSSRRGLLDDYIASQLNRNDATDDIQVLRGLKECGCSLANALGACTNPSKTFNQSLRDYPSTSLCCTCLRRNRTFFRN